LKMVVPKSATRLAIWGIVAPIEILLKIVWVAEARELDKLTSGSVGHQKIDE